jgi:tetratricopeptide (TPR) repeat protein
MSDSRQPSAAPVRQEVIWAHEVPDENPSSRGPGQWTVRLLILGMTALVLGPLLYVGIPAEIARWHEAAGVNHLLHGDYPAALESFDVSLAWAPNNPSTYQHRGDVHLEADDYQAALQDYTCACELQPRRVSSLRQRGLAYQRLGRHAEAIQDHQRVAELTREATASDRAEALNGLAYARAVANQDLEAALSEINQALELVYENAAMLDTRGFIYLLQGNFPAAQADLDQAVQGAEQDLTVLTNRKDYVDRLEFERQLAGQREGVAVIRYHRALLYERLGQADAATKDLDRVRQLGHQPGPGLF